MDYYSITSSEVEWKAAICLCGTTSCRGSFLHYATQDELQQVLNQNCGPLWRYQSLLRACSPHSLMPSDEAVLKRHGMHTSALGSNPKQWIKKYVADNLRFIEFERKALPCALMRNKSSQYTFSAAGAEILDSYPCRFPLIGYLCFSRYGCKKRDGAEDAEHGLLHLPRASGHEAAARRPAEQLSLGRVFTSGSCGKSLGKIISSAKAACKASREAIPLRSL